jgi:predicted phage-related endonuclease
MSHLDAILAHPTQTHDLVQGTPEWDAFRLAHRGASEAAAMLGLSRNVTRTELLQAKHSGIAREFSDFVQKRVLDKGHEVEALARPIIEKRIGEDLYPATYSRGILSASCDGVNLGDTIVMEHKQWNEALAEGVRAGVVPSDHMPQCQQILLVTGAERVIFVVSDGTEARMVSTEVLPERDWWERIAAGWAQFDADLATYVPAERAPEKIIAEPVEALPAPVVQVSGQLTLQDNFKVFEQRLRDFLEHRLIRQPKTDEDFVNLDAQIKAMKQARESLKAAEAQMLAQVQPVDQAKKTKDMLDSLLQQNVSMAERLLTAEKERRKGEIVAGGVAELNAHIAKLNGRFARALMPAIHADFGGVIKGLKSLASMEDKVATELSRAKIVANETADGIDANLKHLAPHAAQYGSLFPDLDRLVTKAPDDFAAAVAARINEHKAKEEQRLEAERERIRAEEADKLRREQEAQARQQREADEAAQRDRNQLADEAAEIARKAAGIETRSLGPAAANSPMPAKVTPIARGNPALKLGDINARIAPLAITEAGLQKLGFPAVKRERNSCLYHEADFGAMCDSIVAHLRMAQEQALQAEAA